MIAKIAALMRVSGSSMKQFKPKPHLNLFIHDSLTKYGQCTFRFSSLKPIGEQSTSNEVSAQQNPQQQNDQKPSVKSLFDSSPSITFTEEDKDLIREDYTNSPTHIKFNTTHSDQSSESLLQAQLQGYNVSENGLQINSKSELQLKDNPLALKTLSEGKIDLTDSRITVNSLNLADSALFGSQVKGIHSISLGNIDVLPQNSILLEDIDVNNIPEDKIIVLERQQKTLYAVGRRVTKQSESTALNSNASETASSNILTVQKRIFEEQSLEEYKDKYLWNFEKDFVTFDSSMLLRALLGTIPFLIFSGFFIESIIELYKCKRDLNLMEEQLLTPFVQIRTSLQQEILLNDPRFNRTSLFPKHLLTK